MKSRCESRRCSRPRRFPSRRELIKLKVDVGTEHRTILAGIAEAYKPDQLVGRTIVMVANLKPRPMMGMESQGMVLAAETAARRRSWPWIASLPAGARGEVTVVNSQSTNSRRATTFSVQFPRQARDWELGIRVVGDWLLGN